MNAVDFLELVLPSTGHIIIAEPIVIPGLDHTPYKHHVYEDLDEAVAKAVDLNFNHKNVFFALAGFKTSKVWNATIKNHDGSVGKWQVRTQANAGWMRSLFLDLDIDPAPASPDKASKVFTTREEAITDLRALCKKVGLPKPMVLDSGGGWHVYWPFDRDMTTAEWQPLADKFKAICQAEKLKIDPAVPSDSARVLRLLGCHNLKRAYAREVKVFMECAKPVDPATLQAAFDTYESLYGVLKVAKKHIPLAQGNPLLGGANNLTKDFNPVCFGSVSFACGVIGAQVASGGRGTTEPLWRACIGLARFASDPRAAMLSVSHLHDDFDEPTMQSYADRWNAGPTTCNYFKGTLSCGECASCPHLGKITSPAQLGNMVIEAESPTIELVNPDTGATETVTLPDPPAPYVRRFNSSRNVNEISIKVEDKDGNPYYTPVSPYDFYPVQILRSTNAGEVAEKTMWRFHLSRMEPFNIEIKQGMLSDQRALHNFMMNVGVYPNASEIKSIQEYMSAYLKHLSNLVQREQVYTRLGWQFGGKDEAERTGFVVGQRHFDRKGAVTTCNIHQNVRNTVKNGLHSKGDLATWTTLVNNHYLGDVYRAHRFFIYCSFAAPLFHLSGHKGVLVAASGKSGRGKTTVLKVGSSIWGAPESLILNGNPDGSTYNAMYNYLGTLHSLPMMWDDTTNREMKDIMKTALNISQGKGKERMSGSDHDGKTVSWETMVLSTTNFDNIAAALASQKGTDADLMRILGVPFEDFVDTTQGKIDADWFTARIYENYGLAGVPFMQHVAANYDAIKVDFEANRKAIDTRVGAKANERYWTAIIAVVYTASQIASKLGLVSFPVQDDLDWMCTHLDAVRELHNEFKLDPVEELAGYLEERISETLVLSSRATSNLDNIALKPQRSLTIRHEMDKGLIYVAKSEIVKYCAEKNESAKNWENQLFLAGVLLERSKLKTLGADTNQYAKGQVRCWVIDANKLGTQFVAAVQQAVVGAGV